MSEKITTLNPRKKKIAKIVLALVCVLLVVALLGAFSLVGGSSLMAVSGSASNVSIMDKFDMYITNQKSIALEGVMDIKKVYWLSDSDLVAPKPNPENYGTASRPEELMWLLEEAADLIGGQEMLFGMYTPVWEGEPIRYYYDETTLVITWKECVGRSMYTISEVKIAHPSQFRRFLADGEYGSAKRYITTDMAKSVNAVVASSGDYYKHRQQGIVVYEGQIKRPEFARVDSCFVDDKGDIIVFPRGEFKSLEQLEQFVEERNIRFSLAFGPVLIRNGEYCVPRYYPLGEIDGPYSRMALCQRDELHYLLVNGTAQISLQVRPTLWEFADVLLSYNVEQAYALDGGQTTVIAMGGKRVTSIDYGYQRPISDIIYFATALPDGA